MHKLCNIYQDKSYIGQLKYSIVEIVSLELALGQFVLPVFVVATRHQKYPLLDVFVDQIYVFLLRLCQTDYRACLHCYLLVNYLPVQLRGTHHKLLVHLLHLQNFLHQYWVQIVGLNRFFHLLFVLENPIGFVVFEHRLNHIPMKLQTSLFILSEMPGAGIEGVDLRQGKPYVDCLWIHFYLPFVFGVQTVHLIFEGLFDLVVCMRTISQTMLNLLYIEVCKESIKSSQIECGAGYGGCGFPDESKKAHQMDRLQLQMRLYLKIASSLSRSFNTKMISQYSSSNHRNRIIDPFQVKKTIKKKQIYDKKSLQAWYDTSLQFWKNAEPDDNGVMLGRADLNQVDIDFSRQFLNETISKTFSARLWSWYWSFERKTSQTQIQANMIEKCEHFVQKAKQNKNKNDYRHFYCCGLQEFHFEHRYDCIWVQWVFTHLPDLHITQFLKRAKDSLQPNGFIIVKENYTMDQKVIDKKDSSIIRSIPEWKSIFYGSKLMIKREKQQPNWPSELYPVKMWLLA